MGRELFDFFYLFPPPIKILLRSERWRGVRPRLSREAKRPPLEGTWVVSQQRWGITNNFSLLSSSFQEAEPLRNWPLWGRKEAKVSGTHHKDPGLLTVTQGASGPRKVGNLFPLSTWPTGRIYKPLCGLQMTSQLWNLVRHESALVRMLSAADCSIGGWDVNYKALLSDWFMTFSALLIMPHWLSHRADWRSVRPRWETGIITDFILFTGQQYYQHWWLFGIKRIWMKGTCK